MDLLFDGLDRTVKPHSSQKAGLAGIYYHQGRARLTS